LQFARLFAKLSQPGDSEVTFTVFKSSRRPLLSVFSHSEIEVYLKVSYLRIQQVNFLA